MSHLDLTEERELCRGKLNLFLDVRGKRADGFHEIVTVFHEVEYADAMTVRRTLGEPRSVRIAVQGLSAGVPEDETNLAARAAVALLELAGSDAALEIVIDKRIPVGSGMGGGSADAAGALRAVNRLLGLAASQDDLLTIARSLGSDVPFQLAGGAALASGRGDVFERIDAATGLRYLLLFPNLSLSTTRVYGALPAHGGPPRRPDAVVAALAAGDAEALAAATFNALVAPAMRVAPEMSDVFARARDRVSSAVQMTGSGSALYLPLGQDEAPAAVGLTDGAGHGFARGVPSRASAESER